MKDCDQWAGRVGQSGPVGRPYYVEQYNQIADYQNQNQTTQR